MSLRRRLVGAVSAVTIVTLGGAFATITVAVNGSQERQLDEALRAEAREEASEASAIGGGQLAISDRPGPAANDVGPLTKYGVIYADDGRVLAETPTFQGRPPALATLPHADGVCFDLWFGTEHLRGVLAPIPRHTDHRLLLAAPRTDLDSDATFIERTVMIVFVIAVGWSILVASWIVRRLTREHEAIAAVARRVAAGDLSARVLLRTGDREIAQLARDVDDMIERLSLLVTSQRRFIAHAAHELRSPLTTLYGELSLALRRERDAAGYQRTITEALDSARRLKLMVEDLLALARAGADAPDPDEDVRLHDAIVAAVESVSGAAREGEVTVDVAATAAVIRGHSRDLERLFRNLVENAIRHSPRGGRVRVTAETAADEVTIAVADEGPGVAEADRDRLFEPFFRGSHEQSEGQPGAGLGLSIAREIARAHGGDVTLDHGSRSATFVVRLPTILTNLTKP
ncbi:Osmosensitive K+ channel histidine kinase KdpD [Minicystis rosea]|nr:Osmosensitive K+ channel histidine kinase KdpD [Minicystis rosea]